VVAAEQSRELLERAVAAHPSPSDEAVNEATAAVETFLERQRAERFTGPELSAPFLVFMGLFAWILVVVPSLLSAAVSRGGLALRLLGIAVVTRVGAEASRLRAFGRALLAWAPLVLAFSLVTWGPEALAALGLLSAPWPNAFFASAMGLLFLCGAIWAVVHPARGLQDRIAGTYLVPR
jgi:hypothetical protein